MLEFNGASLLFLLHEILSGVWGAPLGLGQKSVLTVHGAEPDHPEEFA